MKTLRIKIKNSISNLIKFLIKIYFAKNLTSKLSPNILMKTLNKKKIQQLKIKLVRWEPNEKPSRRQSIFIKRGLNPLFHHPVLLLILICHNSESNCARQKSPIWGSFSNRKKGLLVNSTWDLRNNCPLRFLLQGGFLVKDMDAVIF